MSRRTARLNAYQLIFGYLFTEQMDKNTFDKMLANDDINDEDIAYMNNVINGVQEHYDDLIDLIKANSKNFRLERIYKPDLAGLLLATYEMKYIDNIPLAVSISEVIDIVKAYSTENSNKFVNGVLKGVYNTLTQKEV